MTSKSACLYAIVLPGPEAMISRRIYKPLSEAIREVEQYSGIKQLIDAASGEVVWERA